MLAFFKEFVSSVVKEGNRLQKHDFEGKPLTEKRYTTMQIVCRVIAVGAVCLLHKGFSDNFAGYIISFLSIFIGLFTSIVLAIHDRSKTLFEGYEDKPKTVKYQLIKIRNYLVQFTGLTAYSILLALIVIVLLAVVLTSDFFQMDIWDFRLPCPYSGIWTLLGKLGVLLVIIVHRLFTVYFLLLIFLLTIYSTTSYFTYIKTEFDEIKPPQT